MKQTLLSILIILTAAAQVLGQQPQIASEQPVIMVWYEDWRLFTRVIEPQVIVAIWADGRVMWSKNSIYGGAPYLEGKIKPETIRTFLESCQSKGYFAAKYIQDHWGPDSWFTGIYISSAPTDIVTRSWHEVAEQNPKIVATSYGLTGLDGESRQAFLKKDKVEYQQYRSMWEDIRKQIASIVPYTGEVVQDAVVHNDLERPIPTIGWTVPVPHNGAPAGHP